MTDITLRKAAALQDLIRQQKTGVEIAAAVPVSLYGNIPDEVRKRAADLTAGVQRLTALNAALEDIRKQTARANVTSGISDLLAEQAVVSERIEVLTKLAAAKPYEGDEVVEKRAERLIGRDEPASPFGRSSGPIETVTVNVLDQQTIDAYAAMLLAAKRRKIQIRDDLAEINAATRISLSAETVKTLEAEGLL